MTLVKGNLIYLVKQYITKNHGADIYAEVVSDLPELKGVIVSDGNYPLQTYQQLLRNCLDKFGEVEFAKLNRYLAEKQLSGILGFVIKFISADRIMSSSQQMWDRIYDEGKAEVVENTESAIRFRISEFRLTQAHIKGMEAYLKRIAEIAMKKDIKVTSAIVDEKTTEFMIYKG